jgi:integrase
MAAMSRSSTHTFPYEGTVADLLERGPRPQGDYLFPAARDRIKGKPATVFNGWGKPKDMFDDLCGVTEWQLYDLRHTFASRALGVSLPTIEKLLNHVSGTFGGIVAVYQRRQLAPRDAQCHQSVGAVGWRRCVSVRCAVCRMAKARKLLLV